MLFKDALGVAYTPRHSIIDKARSARLGAQFLFDIALPCLTMLQQLYLDTANADATLDDGTHVSSPLDPHVQAREKGGGAPVGEYAYTGCTIALK
jgi:hypothetical protein